jgi:hypothetical protein
MAAIAIGAARPGIAVWLGHGYDRAALFAAILFGSYGISLLPGPDFAHRRAIGAPGLEGLFGVVTVVLNVVATVTLGLLAGAIGVVVATAIAYTLGTAWVLWRLRRADDFAPARVLPPTRVLMALPVAAAAMYAAGQELVGTLPRFVALAGLGVSALIVLALYLLVAIGPATARELVRARRERALAERSTILPLDR